MLERSRESRSGARVVLMAAMAWLALTLGACAMPQQPWLQVAIDDAAARQKPLVVEFYASWCKPCKHFEAHILTDPRVQAALADVIFVRYDIDGRTGHDAAERCRSRGVPTVVAIDANGVVRLKKTGTEQSADEFLAFLEQAKHVLAAP